MYLTFLSQACHKVVVATGFNTACVQGCCQLVISSQPIYNLVITLYMVITRFNTTWLQGCCQVVISSQPAHNLVIWLSQGCHKVVTTLWFSYGIATHAYAETMYNKALVTLVLYRKYYTQLCLILYWSSWYAPRAIFSVVYLHWCFNSYLLHEAIV